MKERLQHLSFPKWRSILPGWIILDALLLPGIFIHLRWIYHFEFPNLDLGIPWLGYVLYLIPSILHIICIFLRILFLPEIAGALLFLFSILASIDDIRKSAFNRKRLLIVLPLVGLAALGLWSLQTTFWAAMGI